MEDDEPVSVLDGEAVDEREDVIRGDSVLDGVPVPVDVRLAVTLAVAVRLPVTEPVGVRDGDRVAVGLLVRGVELVGVDVQEPLAVREAVAEALQVIEAVDDELLVSAAELLGVPVPLGVIEPEGELDGVLLDDGVDTGETLAVS